MNSNSEGIAGLIILIGVAIMALIWGAQSCSNLSGSNQEKALQEAKKFAADAYPGATATCSGGDSDHDGYVSCTVFPQGENAPKPFSIQCVGEFTTMSDGCKLTPAVIQGQGQ